MTNDERDLIQRLQAADSRERPYQSITLTPDQLNDVTAAATLLAQKDARIEELRHLIWEMDEQVSDCCGCLSHIDEEFRARINEAALSGGTK